MAYRADIEIAVRGAQELKRLQNEVSATAKLVDQLNNYLENIGDGGVVRNINNLRDVLGKAAAAFNDAALGTDEAITAAKKYITATGSLNAGLRERAELLKQITEQERKARLAASGVRETTQYAGPIGPGQASPVALASQLRGRTDQILAERKGRAELNTVLRDQFEAERQLVNSKLDAKAARVQQSLDQQAAAAAESAAQIEKLADRQQEFTARTEAAARAASAQTAEFIRQQRITRQMRGLSAQAPEGGFPTAGPMTSPGFRGMQRSVGQFGENLALGAGFPLLFGGGAGSVLGSIAGSFVGSGFGGQILGGAIGQVLDQALLRIRDIGTAIKELDFSSLVESGIRFTEEIQSQLNLLLQVGDAVTAQKILSQEVARETGTLPGVTEDVANSVNILNDSWRKTINAVGTTVGIIAAPLAVAIAGILEVVNLIFRGVNQIFSLLGKGIKTAAEFVIQLVGGKDALEFINQGIAQLNSGLSEAVATAAEFRNTLNQTVVRTSIDLTAAQALTTGLTSEDKITNIRVEKQRQLNQLYQDEADERIKIRRENARAGQEEIDRLIKQNDLVFKNKKELIEITAERQITAEVQREQARLAAEEARAAEKAARELERQRKEMERMAKLRAQQFIDAQRGYVLAEASLGVTVAGDIGGEKAKVQAEFDKQRAERMFRYTELLEKALSDEERITLAFTQQVEAENALVQLSSKLLSIDTKRAELLNAPTVLANAQQELDLLAAKIQGKEREYIIQKKITDLITAGADPEQARGLILTIEDLNKQNQLIQDQKQLWANIYSTISGELQNSIRGLIDGTAEWGDILSNILSNLASIFLNAAFSGIGKGLKLPGFAEGGFVTGPTTAVIAEGGQPEYVIPQSKMASAMARYASGIRGENVVNGAISDNRAFLDSLTTGVGSAIDSASDDPFTATAATRDSIRESERLQENRMQILNQETALERRYERERIEQMASTPGNLNIRYESQVINNVEYVTRDQAERMAAQSALRGRELAIGALQNSVKTRKRVGI